jgi:23S rRNA pseudouridine1911/1915/1917 synthase
MRGCHLLQRPCYHGKSQIEGRQERNPRRKLEGNEEILIYWPRKGTRRVYEVNPGRILFRDASLLAYDKEAGIPSQQTPSDGYNNLFAALFRYLEGEGCRDPYVALHHRLDRETSGVMIFAVDRSVNALLGRAFQQHRVVKDYLAWVSGIPAREHWVSSLDIGRTKGRYCAFPKGQGKAAETAFQVLFSAEELSLLLARPKTGRTHQIRLHLSAAGHPVLGDRLYGGRPPNRLYLHAYRLSIPHPLTHSRLALTAPIPPDWPEPRSITMPG